MAREDSSSANGGRPPPTVGIVAALWKEALAMRSVIPDAERLASSPNDPNEYYLGTLPSVDHARPHEVVVTTLTRDNTRYAAASSTDLIRSFPSLRCIVMVGIAGGIPAPDRPRDHVRLGDIVVARYGVVDYAHAVRREGEATLRRQVDGLCHPLIRAADELASRNFKGTRPWEEWLDVRGNPEMKGFARPPDHTDVLYIRGVRAAHPARRDSGHRPGKPKVHNAVIGSADFLVQDEAFRNQLAAEHGIAAIEMEAAGIAVGSAAHDLQWFMVRGVADYCDDHKNESWQAYASLTAAAYVRAILEACRPLGESAEMLPMTASAGPTPVPVVVAPKSQPGAGRPAPRIRQTTPVKKTTRAIPLQSWRHRVVAALAEKPFFQKISNRRKSGDSSSDKAA